MKIYIGNYPHRLVCNIHRDYMYKKYDFKHIKKKDQTTFENFLEKLEDSIQWVYNGINWLVFDRLERKTKIKIHPYDTWCVTSTLSPIILPMLIQLKEQKQGAPFVDIEDVPESLRPTEEEIEQYKKDGTTDDKFFDRWDYIIDCMIFSFENLANDDWEEQFYSGEHDIKWIPLDKDDQPCEEDEAEFWQMSKTDKDTFEVDYEGMKEYSARIDKGLMLFGKYFRNLWI